MPFHMELCNDFFPVNNWHNCWGKLKLRDLTSSLFGNMKSDFQLSCKSLISIKLLWWTPQCVFYSVVFHGHLFLLFIPCSKLSCCFEFIFISTISKCNGHKYSHATCCIQNVLVPRQPRSNLHVEQHNKSTLICSLTPHRSSQPVRCLKILVKALPMFCFTIMTKTWKCVLNFSWNLKLKLWRL